MFKIAGKDFYEYVAYRLKKDKLGFLPSSKWNEGSTDTKTYIKAVVPNSAYDFLVYAHELGHCKSEQFINPTSSYSALFGSVDFDRLRSEFNAWVWAIRYIKKLKLEVSVKEWTDALTKSFKSYTMAHSDSEAANSFIKKLNDMLGISLEIESERIAPSIVSFKIIFDDAWTTYYPTKPKKVEKVVPINKKHKPWMDMLDNQRKKHQRHSRKFA